MATIPSQTNFPTSNQKPDSSILDNFNKQVYLGNGFVIPITGVSLSNTSETNVLLMTNPSSNANVPATRKSMCINLRRYSSSAQQVLIKLYVNAIISSTTTALVPVNQRPANSNTSISACYNSSNFTVSSNGTLASALAIAAYYYVTTDGNILFFIDPGQNILITATALVSTTLVNADVSWYEL